DHRILFGMGVRERRRRAEASRGKWDVRGDASREVTAAFACHVVSGRIRRLIRYRDYMAIRWFAILRALLLCYSSFGSVADEPACTCEERCHRDRERAA